jgi:hypothetical protein
MRVDESDIENRMLPAAGPRGENVNATARAAGREAAGGVAAFPYIPAKAGIHACRRLSFLEARLAARRLSAFAGLNGGWI